MTTLSPEQIDAIANVVPRGSNCMMIQAVAGSGKTFTLFEISRKLEGFVAFVAYSSDIVKELKVKSNKIQSEIQAKLTVKTAHGYGRTALVKAFPKSKLDEFNNTKFPLLASKLKIPVEIEAVVKKLYDLARDWNVGSDDFKFNNKEKWMELVERFDIEEMLIPEDSYGNPRYDVDVTEQIQKCCTFAARMIHLGQSPEILSQHHDFGDMIYSVLYHKLRMFQFDTVLVDECQDLNPARIAFTEMMLKRGGQIIFVGDPHQAIFGFTGADSDSIPNIIKRFECKVLPLSVSFRCAQSVVGFVNQWVKHIRAHPEAPVGIAPPMKEAVIDAKDIFNYNLNVNDAILCRNNAPLVDLFFKCLIHGIPAHIEGKSIAEELIQMINRFKKVSSLNTLRDKMEVYREKQTTKWQLKGLDSKIEKLNDILDCINVLIDNLPASANVETLKMKIMTMFFDDKGDKAPTLTLTSIHKSKGREWHRVFWYGRNRYNPSPYAKKTWQMDQEINLMYVAGTRAKEILIDVIVPVKEK
jgi:superfamily I DNA/RNA helicase